MTKHTKKTMLQTYKALAGNRNWPVLTTRRLIPTILIILSSMVNDAAPMTCAVKPMDVGSTW